MQRDDVPKMQQTNDMGVRPNEPLWYAGTRPTGRRLDEGGGGKGEGGCGKGGKGEG